MTRNDVRAIAKRWAQIADAGGVRIVVTDGDEAYDSAIDQAEVQYSLDRPRNLVKHASVTTAGFVQALSGTGALLTGWLPGVSLLSAVWFPYTGAQTAVPLDPNSYRVQANEDGSESIWFLGETPAVGNVIRFEYRGAHHVDEDNASATTVPDGHLSPFSILTAYYVLLMAAARAAQNTGNIGLPGDVVDRRTQSDIYKARAKDLWSAYAAALGIGTPVDAGGKGADAGSPQSGFIDLNAQPGTPVGFLWRRR